MLPLPKLARTIGAVTDKHLGWMGPLLLRITVGVVFMGTGWGKIHDLPKVVAFFTDLHIPAPAAQAWFVSRLELVGGLCVLLGLGTRVLSIPLGFTMVIAMLTAKAPDLEDVHGLDRLTTIVGWQEWSYLVMYLCLVFIGPGKASLDHLILQVSTRSEARPGAASEVA